MFKQTLSPDHPRLASVESQLGRILATEHKDKEAESVMLASYEKMQRQRPQPLESLANTRYNLHMLYLREGNRDRARFFADAEKQ